jgi:DNA-nicking Smr family endonuclease
MARRQLSPEERELWRRVTSGATPIRDAPSPNTAEIQTRPLRPQPERSEKARFTKLTRPIKPKIGPPLISLNLAPDPHLALDRAHPNMDRRRFDKMLRGRLDPEARLDLHGMTSERAHSALRAFILAAHAEGMRLVLVITGKGREGDGDALAPQRHGVLRHSLPHWLAQPPLRAKVLQLAPAHLKHGGGGAYYVYLRRQR